MYRRYSRVRVKDNLSERTLFNEPVALARRRSHRKLSDLSVVEIEQVVAEAARGKLSYSEIGIKYNISAGLVGRITREDRHKTLSQQKRSQKAERKAKERHLIISEA